MYGDHLLFERGRPNQVQKEALATAILADDKSNGRSTINYTIDISKERRYFVCPPDLNVLQTSSRNNPAASDCKIASRSRGLILVLRATQ